MRVRASFRISVILAAIAAMAVAAAVAVVAVLSPPSHGENAETRLPAHARPATTSTSDSPLAQQSGAKTGTVVPGVDALARKANKIGLLVPQPGQELGFGFAYAAQSYGAEQPHVAIDRGIFIRMIPGLTEENQDPFDAVTVMGASKRGSTRQGTGYLLSICSTEVAAERRALVMTFNQRRLPPEPGFPEGTLTGLPLGEISWYTSESPLQGSPPIREMSCGVVVYDSTIALRSSTHYPIDASDGSPGSERITDEDLLMAEYQARLILSAALLVENDFDSMPRGEMTVGGSRVPTRRTADGATLVPLARWAEAVGATVASGAPGRGVFPGGFVPVLPNSGVWSVTRGDRTVIVPLAARAIIVETVRVDLPFPVVKSGDEVWVAVEAIAEALLR